MHGVRRCHTTAWAWLFSSVACPAWGADAPAPRVDTPSPAPAMTVDPRVPEASKAAVRSHMERFAAVEDVGSFASALQAAEALASSLDEPLQALHTDVHCTEANLDLEIPGLDVHCVAEGTMAHATLPLDPWRALAATTPGRADDDLVALNATAYRAMSAESFPVWMVQTWDYGGCSALGTGKVVDILIATDRALMSGSEVFAAQIARVRTGALGEFSERHSQYCSGQDPMPHAQLTQEADRILNEVNLSDAEREAVTAWKPKLIGERFTGG